LEKEANFQLESMAATVMAFAAEAGEVLAALAPSLPAAMTDSTPEE
jgi:hypothetical protein